MLKLKKNDKLTVYGMERRNSAGGAVEARSAKQKAKVMAVRKERKDCTTTG